MSGFEEAAAALVLYKAAHHVYNKATNQQMPWQDPERLEERRKREEYIASRREKRANWNVFVHGKKQ